MSTYDQTNEKRLRELAAAVSALELLKKREAFDPVHLDSRPTPIQQEVIDDFGKVKQQWIRAGNQSGKSQTCARIITWVLTDTHPSWKRPASWGDEPLLVIVCGRTGKQIEDSLLPKIRGYLEPGTYKEVRIGNIIQRVEMSNGNRIIFQSLENPTVARERLQSYVAHAVWVDELPPTMDIVRELLIRVQARDGYYLASFTPTVVSPDIQKYVDGLTEPEAKVYRFHMLDNPLYSNPKRKEELLSRYAHLPPSQQDMVFRGEWLSPEGLVYFFDYETMVEMPEGYSPLWRHVASVDPATQSKLGLTLWAEKPSTKVWYMVRAEYIEKVYVPTEIVAAVEFILKDYNVVKRISDSEASWFINQARVAPFNKFYDIVPNKSGRKDDLIKGLQQFLAGRGRVSPTCIDFISEIQQCRWSDTAPGRIVNASSFHLLDSAQYFCDQVPPPEKDTIISSSWQQTLYLANEKRQKKVEEVKQRIMQKARLKNNKGRRTWRVI